MKPEVWNAIFKRAIVMLLAATVIMFVITEGVYLLRKDRVSRSPQVIELTIPAGTADRVEQGQALEEIPRQMIFVVGDTLLVNNQDDVAHELGPLWVPPGRSASLNLELVSDFSYSCSFTPSKYLGLTVKEATTWKTRLVALGYGVPPLFMFFMVYSFVIWPLKTGDQTEVEEDPAGQKFQPQWGWRQFEEDHDLPGPNQKEI